MNLILHLIGSVCRVYFKQTDSYFFSKINIRENRTGSQEWTSQRHGQLWVLKTQDEDKYIKIHNTENYKEDQHVHHTKHGSEHRCSRRVSSYYLL